jgi:hypothetical protein
MWQVKILKLRLVKRPRMTFMILPKTKLTNLFPVSDSDSRLTARNMYCNSTEFVRNTPSEKSLSQRPEDDESNDQWRGGDVENRGGDVENTELCDSSSS